MAAEAELERVKIAILEKNRELLKCDEVELPRVARELQRLRVALITLNELITNVSDPTAKQEISLLSKMLTGRLESGEGEAEEALEVDAAKARLATQGIDPASADNMARGLRALQAVMLNRGTRSPDPS